MILCSDKGTVLTTFSRSRDLLDDVSSVTRRHGTFCFEDTGFFIFYNRHFIDLVIFDVTLYTLLLDIDYKCVSRFIGFYYD